MGPREKTTAQEEAYSLYREARSHWQRRTPVAVRMAIRSLEKAITIDGSLAEAAAALADCYSILMDYGILSPRQGLTAARLASGRALLKGPEKAECLTAAALVRQMDLDWAAAETEFVAAIQAHPGYTVARQRYALFLAYMGREVESRREIRAALELDPNSPATAASAAWVEYYRGQSCAAVELARDALLRHPHFSSSEVVLALSLTDCGQPDEGSSVLERALNRERENVSLLALLAFVRSKEGRPQEAERLSAVLRAWREDRYVSPYYFAVPHIGLGENQEALDALERGFEERSPQLVYLHQEPLFRPVRGESRFKQILAKLELPYRPDEVSSHGLEVGPAVEGK